MKKRCFAVMAAAVMGLSFLTGCTGEAKNEDVKPETTDNIVSDPDNTDRKDVNTENPAENTDDNTDKATDTPENNTLDNKEKNRTDNLTESDNNADNTDNLISVGFAQVGHESAWRMAATTCAQETFSESKGYNLVFVDADNNPETQKEAVRSFIEQRLDYIVIDPIVTYGWNEVLKEAKTQNIPVFLIDRTIDCDDSLYVAWFGSDFEGEGEAAGAWLQTYLEAKGRQDEEINIVTIAGTIGSAAQLGRTRGFGKYLNSNTNWTRLEEKDGMFTEEDGKKVMKEFLDSYDNKIDVVICHNDNEAWGAMEALDEAGISYGVNGDVIIVSFDAVHDGLKRVLDGKINADFECNPLSAPYVADAINDMENGKKVKKKINYIDEGCFQAEDIVTRIEYGKKTMRMLTVTEKMLEERAY